MNLMCNIASQEQAKNQLELFKRFVDMSGQALGMANLDGQIFYANSTMCRLLGEMDTDSLYKRTVFAFYAPEVATYLKDRVHPIVLRDGQWSGELILTNARGSKISTIQNIYLIRDGSGEPMCLANVITDISEHVRMEEQLRTYRDQLEHFIEERLAALQKSERAFRALFEAAPGPMCLIKDRIILAVNPAMARSIGYSQEELTNMPASVLYVDEEEYTRAGKIIYESGKQVEMMTIETRLRHKDGSIIHALLSLCPLNPQDLSAGIIVTGIDITGCRELDKQIEQSHSYTS